MTIEDISLNFITKKTPEQIEGKIKDKFSSAPENSDFEESYSEILKFYGTEVKKIIDKSSFTKSENPEFYLKEKLIEDLSTYFSSIKKELTKVMKKNNSLSIEKSSLKSEKSESTTSKIRESTSFLRLLKEDASTKMTEEDRKFFIKDENNSKKNKKKILKKNKGKELKEENGNFYDLTIEGIELPRVRQRSNSLHLGKRRFENLPVLDLEFEVTTKKKELKVKDDNSVFFMVTNNLFKSGVSVKGC